MSTPTVLVLHVHAPPIVSYMVTVAPHSTRSSNNRLVKIHSINGDNDFRQEINGINKGYHMYNIIESCGDNYIKTDLLFQK